MDNQRYPRPDGKGSYLTGANQGLGLETSRALAGHGAKVILAVRTLSKGEAAIDNIRADHPAADLELQRLDLAPLDSIRTAAGEIRGRLDRIDVLISNAGAMFAPQQETADGFGIQFGTNHLGHFAWTGLLIDRLLSVLGIPLYACGGVVIPLVNTLLENGMSVGAAMAFLIVGPGTRITPLLALGSFLSRRMLTNYVSALLLFSIASGTIINVVLSP